MFSTTNNYKKYSNLEFQLNYLHVLELVHPDLHEREEAHKLSQEIIKKLNSDDKNDSKDSREAVIEEFRHQFNQNLKEDPKPLSDEVWFSISDSDDENVRKSNYLLSTNYNPKNQEILEKYYQFINQEYDNLSKYQAEETFGENGYHYILEFLNQIKEKYKPEFDDIYKDVEPSLKKDWNRRYLFKEIQKEKQKQQQKEQQQKANENQKQEEQKEIRLEEAITALTKIWKKIYDLDVIVSYEKAFGLNNDGIYRFEIYQNLKLIGVIYGDFIKREGKYHRGMTTDLFSRSQSHNNCGHSYVITSFDNQDLKLINLKTLFHEMGHGLHKAITMEKLSRETSTFQEVPANINENLIYSHHFREITNLEFTKEKVNVNQIIGDLISSYMCLEFFTNSSYIQNNCSKKIYQELTGFSLDNEDIHPEFNLSHLFTLKSQYYLYLVSDLLSFDNEPESYFLTRMIENNFRINKSN